MKLIRNAKEAYKFWSVQANVIAFLLALAEFVSQVLPLWRDVIPDGTFAIAAAVTSTAAMGLRLIKQGDDDAK